MKKFMERPPFWFLDFLIVFYLFAIWFCRGHAEFVVWFCSGGFLMAVNLEFRYMRDDKKKEQSHG